MPGCVRIERFNNDVCVALRLSNPSRKNALSTAMWQAIGDFAAQAAADLSIRAIMIRGDGNLFSAGADISDFAEGRSGAEMGSTYDDLVEMTCRAVEAIPQPTVAVIEGVCFGAGLSLAASCNLRIAGEGVSFCVPAARLGLGYDVRGIQRFNRIFGVPTTTHMLLTGDRLLAARAHAIGAVQMLVPTPEIDREVKRLLAGIVAGAPLTLRAATIAQRALTTNDQALIEEALASARLADDSADYREGRQAFADKRTPKFEGR
jgi:enoyl-CoA hydratase/carnithine racemase